MTQASIRQQISELALVAPTERLACIVRMESESLLQLADIRSHAARSTDRFGHYADLLAIQELEARLDFLRGLKFDLVKADE